MRDWQNAGMPGEIGNYPLREIITWFGETIAINRWKKKGGMREIREQQSKNNPSKSSKLSDLKEEQLRIKNQMENLKYAERARELIPVEHIDRFMKSGSGYIRRAGELLRKHFGNEAQKMLLDNLDAWDKEWSKEFGNGDTNDSNN